MRMRKLAAEALGTFALVFAGTGAIVVDGVSGGAVTHVGISLTFGFVVMALIYALGDVSGAHLNPAVTFGFWLGRRFPGRDVAPYIAAQLVGAFAASAALAAMFTHPTLGATIPAGSLGQSFALETFLTAFLMFVVLNVSAGSKETGIMAGAAIGAVIALEALFAGPICGASMNPARSLAPAIVSGNVAAVWIYVAAPILGSMVGLGAFLCVRPVAEATIEHRRNQKEKSPMKRVVFVCVENSNRSQMAQAFAKRIGGVEAFSAGSRPSGRVNPKAIAAMQELGYDLTTHHSKSLADLPDVPFDAAVTMGCGDECPTLRAARRIDWRIPDPKEMPPEEFRAVRDLIESKVAELLRELSEPAKE